MSAVQWAADLIIFGLFRAQRIPCGTWADRSWAARRPPF